MGSYLSRSSSQISSSPKFNKINSEDDNHNTHPMKETTNNDVLLFDNLFTSKKLLISYLSAVYQCNNKYIDPVIVSKSMVPNDTLLAMKKACELSGIFEESWNHDLDSSESIEKTSQTTLRVINNMSLPRQMENQDESSTTTKPNSRPSSCLPSQDEIHQVLIARNQNEFRNIHNKILGCFRNDLQTIQQFKQFSDSFTEWHTRDSMYTVFSKEVAIMKKIVEHGTNDNSLFKKLKYDANASNLKNKHHLSKLIHTFYDAEYERLIDCLFINQNSDKCIREWQDLFIPVSACFCVESMEECLKVDVKDKNKNSSRSKTNALNFIDCATLRSDCSLFMEQVFATPNNNDFEEEDK